MLHRMFPYGYLGAVSIALRSFRQTSWKDTDFLGNIKVKPVAKLSQLGTFGLLRPSPAPFEFMRAGGGGGRWVGRRLEQRRGWVATC